MPRSRYGTYLDTGFTIRYVSRYFEQNFKNETEIQITDLFQKH